MSGRQLKIAEGYHRKGVTTRTWRRRFGSKIPLDLLNEEIAERTIFTENE